MYPLLQTSLCMCLGLRACCYYIRFVRYESHYNIVYNILEFGMSVCQLTHEAVYSVGNRQTFLYTLL